jgi:hypothetical protein
VELSFKIEIVSIRKLCRNFIKYLGKLNLVDLSEAEVNRQPQSHFSGLFALPKHLHSSVNHEKMMMTLSKHDIHHMCPVVVEM